MPGGACSCSAGEEVPNGGHTSVTGEVVSDIPSFVVSALLSLFMLYKYLWLLMQRFVTCNDVKLT